MVLWGGLLPIPRQLMLDLATLLGWTLAQGALTLSPFRPKQKFVPGNSASSKLLLASCLLTLLTSGLSNRWTLTIVIVTLWICHGLQRWLAHGFHLRCSCGHNENNNTTVTTTIHCQSPSSYNYWVFRTLLQSLSLLLIVAGAVLSVLFPAVQLPSVTEGAPFQVGVLDFFVPVVVAEIATVVPPTTTTTTDASDDVAKVSYYIPARLWYPAKLTKQRKTWFSAIGNTINNQQQAVMYLDPTTSVMYCRHSMRFGAPPPLNAYGWILHTWRLIALPVLEYLTDVSAAPQLTHEEWRERSPFAIKNSTNNHDNNNDNVPLVFYSHGLGGVLQVYSNSYQAMELAAHGAFVVSVTHADGSAPVAITLPSTQPELQQLVEYDYDILKLWTSNRTVEYAQRRRQKTDQRTLELLAATTFVHERIARGRRTCFADPVDPLSRPNTKHQHQQNQSHQPLF